jgi:WD40 repeat protein
LIEKDTSSELLETIRIINYPRTIVLLNNDSRAVIGFLNPIIRIWDLKTKAEIAQLIGHTEQVNKIIKLQDNTSIASASNDGSIKIWNSTNGKLLKTLKVNYSGPVNDLVLLSDGRLVSCSKDYLMGDVVYGNLPIEIWNVTSGLMIKDLFPLSNALSIILIKSDLLASSLWDMTICFWNISTGSVVKVISGENDIALSLVLLPNGYLASGEQDWTIKVWNIDTGRMASCLEGHTDFVLVLIHLNTSHIASASRDATIKIWNYDNGALLQTLISHSDSVTALAFLNDGTLASVSYDKTVKIWNLPVIFKYPNRSNLIPYQDF